jgi:hypothetical protein
MISRTVVFLLAGLIGALSVELGDRLFHRKFTAEAQTLINRPLTPVDVTGVARRTARHCALGVTDCYY